MSVWSRLEKVVNQSIEASKDAIDKARETAKDVGEKGALKVEVMTLERRSVKLATQLGSEVYEAFEKRGQDSVSRNTKGVKELLEQLVAVEQEIDAKELQLKAAE